MEKYFRADINKDSIIIDLIYNEEQHTFVIEEDFEDSWTDVVIEGEDRRVNVYFDDVTNDIKMSTYTEIDGVLGDDEVIECDGYDIMDNLTIDELLKSPKTDFTLEFTVEQLEKMLANAKDNGTANNVYDVERNVESPSREYYSINVKINNVVETT